MLIQLSCFTYLPRQTTVLILIQSSCFTYLPLSDYCTHANSVILLYKPTPRDYCTHANSVILHHVPTSTFRLLYSCLFSHPALHTYFFQTTATFQATVLMLRPPECTRVASNTRRRIDQNPQLTGDIDQLCTRASHKSVFKAPVM